MRCACEFYLPRPSRRKMLEKGCSFPGNGGCLTIRLVPSRGNTHALLSTAFLWYCPWHSERLRSAGFPRSAAAVVPAGRDESLLQCQLHSAQGVQGTCQVRHSAGGASISRRGETVRKLPFTQFQPD